MVQRIIHILLLLLLLNTLKAQKTELYHTYNKNYKKALSLYENEKYKPAQKYFGVAIKELEPLNSTLYADAKLYYALCAVKLFNEDANYLIWEFIEKHPESLRLNEAYMEMCRNTYRNDKFEESIEWLKKVNTYKLNEEEYEEYYFIKGYSYYKLEHFDTARVAFFQVLNGATKYHPPSLYYYSHINYEQKNLQTALNGFIKLKDDNTFSSISPYYIVQILFKQEKYEKITKVGPPLFENISDKRREEFSRIIGEAFYQFQDYDSALHYFKYLTDSSNLSKDDMYRVAYTYYRKTFYDEASKYFEPLTNDTTKLAQNSLFHLADCYIKTNQKQKAALAFRTASEMNKDSIIKRDALFNYAMLTYDLSYSPFNEAIDAFTKFINDYPESEKSDIAFKYLMLSYLHTKNYKDAWNSLQKIKIKGEEVNEAAQRIAYYRAIELYTSLNFEDALNLFNYSLKHSKYNHKLKAKALYWKAETYYRIEKYKEAATTYSGFIKSLAAFEMKEFNDAHYGIAYSYFNLKNYKKASEWFRKYTIMMEDIKENNKLADAYNRIGDCFFMQADYTGAIKYYNKNIKLDIFDVDYALFQEGFCYGLNGNYNKKTEILEILEKKHFNSAYTDDALFEVGNAYIMLKDNIKAVNKYKIIVDSFPNSLYRPKALTQIGLIRYNNDQLDKALKTYKTVVEDYKGTPEEKNALIGIKNIYLDKNEVDKYFNYLKETKGIESISENSRDSLKYIAAENVYMKNDCEKAINLFNDYLNTFPEGSFKLNAYFYLADCYFRSGDLIKALENYNEVTEMPRNLFSEEAYQGIARIYYKNENFQSAMLAYKELEKIAEVQENIREAKIQQFRCHYNLNEYKSVISLGKKLLSMNKISEAVKNEVSFKIGKSFYAVEEYKDGREYLAGLAERTSTIEGAESKYLTAEMFYERGYPEEAKRVIFEFIDKNTPHRFWLAKSFILLAKIYKEEKDNFQAIHTLKSIIDNYENENDGILNKANKLLEKIEKPDVKTEADTVTFD